MDVPIEGASTPAYAGKYENLALTRDEHGVLVLRFHTDDGPIVFTGRTHEDLPAALEEISLDRENKALVQRQTLNINLRRRIIQDVPFGMALKVSLPPTSPIRGELAPMLKGVRVAARARGCRRSV